MTVKFSLLTVLRECAHEYDSKIRLSLVWHRDHLYPMAHIPTLTELHVCKNSTGPRSMLQEHGTWSKAIIIVIFTTAFVCIYASVLHLIIARIISHSPTSFDNKYSCLWLMTTLLCNKVVCP